MLRFASTQDLQRLRRHGYLLRQHRSRLPEPRPPSGQRERIPLPGRVSPTNTHFNISNKGHSVSVCNAASKLTLQMALFTMHNTRALKLLLLMF